MRVSSHLNCFDIMRRGGGGIDIVKDIEVIIFQLYSILKSKSTCRRWTDWEGQLLVPRERQWAVRAPVCTFSIVIGLLLLTLRLRDIYPESTGPKFGAATRY